jgi:hypothetical protein
MGLYVDADHKGARCRFDSRTNDVPTASVRIHPKYVVGDGDWP